MVRLLSHVPIFDRTGESTTGNSHGISAPYRPVERPRTLTKQSSMRSHLQRTAVFCTVVRIISGCFDVVLKTNTNLLVFPSPFPVFSLFMAPFLWSHNTSLATTRPMNNSMSNSKPLNPMTHDKSRNDSATSILY